MNKVNLVDQALTVSSPETFNRTWAPLIPSWSMKKKLNPILTQLYPKPYQTIGENIWCAEARQNLTVLGELWHTFMTSKTDLGRWIFPNHGTEHPPNDA